MKIIEKQLIALIKKETTVTSVARNLGVSRVTIYAWLTKYSEDWLLWLIDDQPWPKFWKAWNRTSSDVETIVAKYLENYPLLWPQTIAHILFEDMGINLDPTTIWRIGKRMHIRYWISKGVKQKRERTLYSLPMPGELQVDVSFPYWRSKQICSYNAIDDCTRWVYWEILEEYWIVESIEFIKSLLEKVPFRVHTIRTDNGKEFWKQFSEYLESIGIKHIKNEPYMPQHNGKVERYHWTRKRLEVIFWTKEMDLEELRYRNIQWLYYYNYHRRHTWLAMQGLTPLKKLIISLSSSQCVKLSMQQYIPINIPKKSSNFWQKNLSDYNWICKNFLSFYWNKNEQKL